MLQVKENGPARMEIYDSGLTVVKPAGGTSRKGPKSSKSVSAGSGRPTPASEPITSKELGLDKHLPWNEHFHIQPHLVGASRCQSHDVFFNFCMWFASLQSPESTVEVQPCRQSITVGALVRE